MGSLSLLTDFIILLSMNLYHRIRKLIGKAIFGFELIQKGDTLLIALSGGEDSLVVTHFLSEWRYYYNTELNLYAIHLDMGFPKEERAYEEGVKYLEKFCEERGIKFLFDKIPAGKLAIEADSTKETSPCFICSWNRRKYLFNLAEKLKISKIVFGHHQDDVITTFFLNVFYCGEISTILPIQSMFKGTLYLIRPLYFVPKEMISRFVSQRGWPILPNPCPFSQTTKRAFWNNYLKENIFALDPILKKNLFSALFNVNLTYLPQKPKKERN